MAQSPNLNPSKVPKGTFARVAAITGQSDGGPVTASLLREGVAGAQVRYPSIEPWRLLRAATDLQRTGALVRDLGSRTYVGCGMRWVIHPVGGLDEWAMTVAANDSTRISLRIAFVVCDVATAEGPADTDRRREIAEDPGLRMSVIRALEHCVVRYLVHSINRSREIPAPIRRYAEQVSRSVLSQTRLFPYMSLTVRTLPNMSGDPTTSFTVDASYQLTVELTTPARSEGTSFSGVEVEDNATYFSVASAADILQSTGDPTMQRVATEIQALNSQARRKRRSVATEEYQPPPTTRVEVVKIGNDPSDSEAPGAVEITVREDGHPEMTKLAGLTDEVREAESWWRGHLMLVRPPLPTIATETIAAFGEAPTKSDVELLIDMAMPRLGEAAAKRTEQFPPEFGVDAATAALARHLRAEFQRRLT